MPESSNVLGCAGDGDEKTGATQQDLDVDGATGEGDIANTEDTEAHPIRAQVLPSLDADAVVRDRPMAVPPSRIRRYRPAPPLW